MKTFFLFTVVFLFPAITFAANKSSTPSATPVSKDVQKKIDNLKERLATKVAELRKTSPRAIFGTITQVSLSSLTVDATQKAYKIELTDDITVAQILKGKRTTLKTENLDKNDVVTIFGNYDETLDMLQANHIFIENQKLPVRLHGKITEINKKDNSFTLRSVDDTNYTIDVEPTTKNNTWTKGKGIEKSGFSKLKTGVYATVVGLENAKQADRYSATRMLTITPPGTTDTTPATSSPTATISSPSASPRVRRTTTPSPRVTLNPTIKE